MKAHEIMTREVITVPPGTPVRDIAALMLDKHISGVPVVTDDGRMVGIVSESDLLHRAEFERKWCFRVLGHGNWRRTSRRRTGGRRMR